MRYKYACGWIFLSGLFSFVLAETKFPDTRPVKPVSELLREGFVPLFNGKDLSGWTSSQPNAQSGFRVVDGTLETYGGMGLLWYSKKRFGDYILVLEWKAGRKVDNSGIFVRFPKRHKGPEQIWHAIRQGYEIQICDLHHPSPKYPHGHNNTGSIYSFKESFKVNSKPAGEWNRFEIICLGQRIVVYENGLKINDFLGDGSRGINGFIGLQNHDPTSKIRFRNILIKELRPAVPEEYDLILWNGLDWRKDGWKHNKIGTFVVEDGLLKTQGGMGILWYAKRKFKDFKLLVEWKAKSRKANSGIWLRLGVAPKEGQHNYVNSGYEVQICDLHHPSKEYPRGHNNTGSIYGQQECTHVASKKPGEWNRYEITVIGQTYTVVLNGETVNVFKGNRALEGYIGLQNHDPGSVLWFRNIAIKEIKK